MSKLKRPPVDEFYFMVPDRLLEALKRGDITPLQFAIAAFLCGEASYRWTDEVVLTLRALADGLGWKTSPDWLRKNLHLLRDAGWISFESRPGQQKPYVIKLVGAAVRRETTSEQTSESEPPSHSEMTSERAAHEDSVLAVADKVANAHREGGVSVSDAERAAIGEISVALGAEG